jgi:hypothetical protein
MKRVLATLLLLALVGFGAACSKGDSSSAEAEVADTDETARLKADLKKANERVNELLGEKQGKDSSSRSRRASTRRAKKAPTPATPAGGARASDLLTRPTAATEDPNSIAEPFPPSLRREPGAEDRTSGDKPERRKGHWSDGVGGTVVRIGVPTGVGAGVGAVIKGKKGAKIGATIGAGSGILWETVHRTKKGGGQ